MRWKIPALWQGADVWIIGGGPSINHLFGVPDDVMEAQKNGKNMSFVIGQYLRPFLEQYRVIAVNNAYQLGDFIDALVFGDQGWWPFHKEKQNLMPVLKITCSSRLKDEPRLYYVGRGEKKLGLVTDRNQCEIAWNHNSGAMAINVALLLGAKRVFLLGFDMKAEKDGVSHWHYRHTEKIKGGKPSLVPYELHLAGFPTIAQDAKEYGMEIYNVNEEERTAIKEFPIIDLETALSIAKKAQNKIISKEASVTNKFEFTQLKPKVAFCCVYWKGFFFLPRTYSHIWVQRMYDMVKKNLSIPYDFYCLSNQAFKYEKIQILPLTNNYSGWWNKLELFIQDKLQEYDQVLYLDLDTFVRGKLDIFFKIAQTHDSPIVAGKRIGLSNDHKRDGKHVLHGIQSALFVFNPKKMRSFGENFVKNSEKIMNEFRGDQDWLKYSFPNMPTFPTELTCKTSQWIERGCKFDKEVVAYACPDKNDVLVERYEELKKIWGPPPQKNVILEEIPQNVNVMCFFWLNKDNPKRGWHNLEVAKTYILRLFRSVKRNLSCKFDFYCFTTHRKELQKDIDSEIIIKDLKSPSMLGCFPKLTAYSDKYDFTKNALNIIFDLDTVMTGSLDFLLTYEGCFMTRGAPPNPHGIAQGNAEGGLVVWRHHKELNSMYASYCKDPSAFETEFAGKERFVYRKYLKADLIIDKYPNSERSYKWEILPNNNKLPEGCRIVSFHGKPHPHEILNLNWVGNHWK